MPVARFPLWSLLAALTATPLEAQLRPNRPSRPVQNLPRLMVSTPYAPNSADSATAVRVGEGMRNRMEDVAGRWFTVITREQMGEALARYGYPPDALLPPSLGRTLASNLQSRFLVSSTMGRTPAGRYSLQVRAVGINDRAGYAVTLSQAPNQSPEDFGKAAADALGNAFKAREEAGKCWDLQLTRPGEAVSAARKALREQPNHGLAEFCLGEIATACKSPRAEVVGHYQNAVSGDPQSLDAWTRLSQLFRAADDTANTIRAYQEMLRVAPTNQPLREEAFKVFLSYGQPEAARDDKEEYGHRRQLEMLLNAYGMCEAQAFAAVGASSPTSFRALRDRRCSNVLSARPTSKYPTAWRNPSSSSSVSCRKPSRAL